MKNLNSILPGSTQLQIRRNKMVAKLNNTPKLCRNKVSIEISVSELMYVRIILGGVKSQEKTFKLLLSGVKKILNKEDRKLTGDERAALVDAVNYPENFSDSFKEFFTNYEFIASLFAYGTDD